MKRTGHLRSAAVFAAVCGFVVGQSAGSERPLREATAQRRLAASDAAFLHEAVQLTRRADFLRAGEAYFSPDQRWIIFQATPVPPEGEEPTPHYEMYAAPLLWDGEPGAADARVAGLGEIVQLSKPGSANTCGWFHPTEPGRVLFGSTVEPPVRDEKAGFQRDGGNYSWPFPAETEMVTGVIPQAAGSEGELAGPITEPLFRRDGYDAEGTWSPGGRWVLYTHVDPETDDPDIWLYDTADGSQHEIVAEPGYDGGPFFAPDFDDDAGGRIIYRSDRRQDKHLQVYIAEVAIEGGTPRLAREHAITSDGHVNWAPYLHPSGEYLAYTTSREGHFNYELFGISAKPGLKPDERGYIRLTDAPGFDGLGVFSPDGRWLMWTAQRGGPEEGDDRPSSQLWIARFDAEAFESALRRADRDALLRETAPAGEPN